MDFCVNLVVTVEQIKTEIAVLFLWILTILQLDNKHLELQICRIVSLDKELYSTLSLFTQVYKGIPPTYCWPFRDEILRMASRGK